MIAVIRRECATWHITDQTDQAGGVAVLYGTRPEAIKLGPIVACLRDLGVRPMLYCTGQHTDLLAGTPAETDLVGSVSLGLPSGGDIPSWIDRALPAVKARLERDRPALVAVQGDTMSAFVGAGAARDLGIPGAHIEAGLRSGTIKEPWPEEWFRRAITRTVRWHFAPTFRAAANLEAEQVPKHRIFVTGNSVVSSLARYGDLSRRPIVPQAGWSRRLPILITMHRREWLGYGLEHVRATVEALCEVARDHPKHRFVWPMHPHVQRMLAGGPPLPGPGNVTFRDPLPYRSAIRLLAKCAGVATDSGGLQEEAATLGIPCAVLRNVTDRPESIEAGVAQLFSPTPNGMFQALSVLVRGELPRKAVSVYGTPDAARQIAEILVRIHRAPTLLALHSFPGTQGIPENRHSSALDAPFTMFPY